MRVVTVAGDPEREAELAGQLELRRDIDLVLRCMDRVEVLGAIRGGALDAVLIVGDPIWFDAQCARDAAGAGTKLIALAPDPLAAERMRRLGASALVADASLDTVIESVRGQEGADVPVARTDGVRGSLCVVWGPKGAPGRSSISFELACVLAGLEPDTLLVDADTYGGDLMQLSGAVDDMGTVVWASRLAAKGELGPAFARELRRVGSQGPVLMPGVPRSDLWPEISEFGWSELLKIAKEAFRFIVCDVGFSLEATSSPYPEGGEGRNRLTRSTLRTADHVIAVVRADPVGVKNFVWTYQQLKELVDEERIHLVANRVRGDEAREVSNLLRRYTGKRPLAVVPDDPDGFTEAVAEARSVATRKPGSPLGVAIREIAAAMGATVPSRGFMARLAGRSR